MCVITTRTAVNVFDVFRPDQPLLVQESIVNGNSLGAQADEQDVYVVVNVDYDIPYVPAPGVAAQRSDTAGVVEYRYQTRRKFLKSLNEVIVKPSPPTAYRQWGYSGLEAIGELDDSVCEANISRLNGSMTNVLKLTHL